MYLKCYHNISEYIDRNVPFGIMFAGQSVVPKPAHQAQTDATGRGGQGTATAVRRRRRVQELAPREQVETGDAEQRVGQRDAPLRGFAAFRTAHQGRRRYDALQRRVQFRGGQRRLNAAGESYDYYNSTRHPVRVIIIFFLYVVLSAFPR